MQLEAPFLILEYEYYLKQKKWNRFRYRPFLEFVNNKYKIVSNIEELRVDNKFKIFINENFDLIDEYYKEITKEYLGSMFRIIDIRKMYTWFRQRNIINDETYEEAKKVFKILSRKGIKSKSLIKKDELDKVITRIVNIWNYYKPLKLKTILYFVYYTGISIEELKRIKRNQIDLEKNRCYLKNRVAFFPNIMKKLLIDYFNSEIEEKGAFNFTNRVYVRINELLEKYSSKNKEINFPLLKENYINRIISKNKNPFIINKLTGLRMWGDEIKKYIEGDWYSIEELQKIYRSYFKEREI